MKRIVALVIGLCFIASSLCSCAMFGNQKNVETSIVYVQVDPNDKNQTTSDNNNQSSNNSGNDAPVDMFSLKNYYYDESPHGIETNDWMPGDKDIYGKMHGNGQRINAWDKGMTIDEYYNINSSYNILSGTIVPGPNCEIVVPSDSLYEKMYAVVYIYGDNKILYTSPEIKCDTQQMDFSVNITGVNQLRIYVVVNGYYGNDVHHMEIGLVDFFLSK